MEQSAEEGLKSALKSHKEFGLLSGQFHKNGVVARNVLHEDLGYYTDKPREYGNDPNLICRLAAHARQDAAHALCNTDTIMDELRRIKGRQRVVIALLVLVLVAIALQHS